MSSTRATAHPAVATYLAAVRDELGDLPADELAEIAEDVRDHLDHVAGEYGDDVTIDVLIDRLGAPAAYAAELRAAAGLPEPAPEPAPVRVGFVRRLLRFMVAFFGWSAVGLGALAFVDTLFGLSGAPAFFGVPAIVAVVLAAAATVLLVTGRDDPVGELRQVPTAVLLAQVEEWVRSMPWGRPAIELVTSLRSAWWLARAVALALIVFAVFRSAPFSVAVFLLAVVGSVWLGRRTAAGEVRGPRLVAVQLANAGLAIGGVVMAGVVAANGTWDGVQYVDGGYDYTGPAMDDGPIFYGENGTQVTNIFPYGADGTLLENVRLYDQDGNPISLGWFEECYGGAYDEQSFVAANPWGDHVFPRPTVEVSPNGECEQPHLNAPFGPQLPGTPTAGTATPAPDPLK
ncbi:HAAS signaling domain-containing protein [Jiangella alkaliphila]|uniref:Uncharacterized protein n=1 Tax=Jiangella alkaliphila TaxID=419479 RepID=A0A1H2M477_9ACTN|nr:hypothetical protein [Jiangella alkaliphila]SDU87748.1 hypothetical protein SAMN04488563_7022 [Jiangella alkaliphila]